MATQPKHNSIKIANPSLEGNARTFLTQDTAIGETTIDIASSTGFDSSDIYILIGDYGDEKAEIVRISASTDSVFTIGATKFSHEASDPVTLIEYNQVTLFGLISLESTSYQDLGAEYTKDLDVTSQFTEIVYTGSTYGYFATAYYNSADDEISGYSETIEMSSFTRKSAERIIRAGARKALTTIDENTNSRLNWDIATEILQDGLDEIAARKKRWEFWHTITTGTQTVADQKYIDKPTDLTQLVRIKVNEKELRWVTKKDYNDTIYKSTQTGEPQIFTEMNGQYYIYPTPNSTYDIEYEYYKIPDVITGMSTELDIPLVPVLIYYCGAQFAYTRGNEKKGDKLYQQYIKLLEEQVIEYSAPHQDGTPEYVERTSIYGIEDNQYLGLY